MFGLCLFYLEQFWVDGNGDMAPRRSPQHGCVWCVSAIKWLPVLFIIAVVVWSYYAYIIQLCLLTIENIFQKILYIILYHGFLAMFAWSYWQTIFTEFGSVPKQFHLPAAEVERLEKEENADNQRVQLERFSANLPVSCRTFTGAIRYCEKCSIIKPDRSHHCSVCGECVLKMDHHCPWVNNCVAFTNYKFFVLFLGYSFLYCMYIAITTLQFFIRFWKNELQGMGKFHILFVFCVAIMFGISLISLFGYHLYLVAKNRSTLEAFRPPIFRSGPDKDGFSLGVHANFLEVFGEERRLWFLPVHTSMGDGVSFPQRLVDDDTDGLLAQRQRWSEEDETQLHAPYDELEEVRVFSRDRPV